MVLVEGGCENAKKGNRQVPGTVCRMQKELLPTNRNDGMSKERGYMVKDGKKRCEEVRK